MSTHFNNELDDYIYPRVIDWPTILKDIRETGLSYSGACRMLGVGWSTMQKWRQGSEPRHSIGSSILLIHAKQCGHDLTKQRVLEARQ